MTGEGVEHLCGALDTVRACRLGLLNAADESLDPRRLHMSEFAVHYIDVMHDPGECLES